MRDLVEDLATVIGLLTASAGIVWVLVRTIQILTS